MISNLYFVIPARAGSKGFPHKNRYLMPFTFNQFPNDQKNIIVTSDDQVVLGEAISRGWTTIDRSYELSSDTASMRDVLLDTIIKTGMNDDDLICLLYLTYVGRKWDDITKSLLFFVDSDARSMLCRQVPKTSPYLCFHKIDDYRGIQIIPHDYYRRQDYPETFQVCHYIILTYAGEVQKLNKNLYNDETIFYPVEDPVDVDKPEDLEDYLELA